jgi:hypothetical protein
MTLAAVVMVLALAAPRVCAQGEPAFDHQNTLDAVYARSLTVSQTQPQGRRPSEAARELAGWITATADNGGVPFLIVDKLRAYIFAFDAVGELLGSAPVLLGLARGDDSSLGIGDLKLSEITAGQRTTPAGRFVGGFGNSDGDGTVLWVDFPDGISLHPVMSVDLGERRLERIRSADPDQHRISYGCINVPKAFYTDVVLPALAGGAAVFYVLPDTKPIHDVFPGLATFARSDRVRHQVRKRAAPP